jgi:hypothetical protein
VPVLPPTQFPVQTQAEPATYGALLDATTSSVALALAADVGPFLTADQAMDTLADYERFMSSAGRHVTLLLDCRSGNHDPSPAVIRQIATDLTGLRWSRRGGNAWAQAADQLRGAHDLLASHLSPRGEARTPDAHLLTKPRVIEAALLRVLDLTAEPIGRADDLLAEARTVQAPPDPSRPARAADPLGQTIDGVGRLMACVPRLAHDPVLRAVDALTPARTKVGADTGPTEVGTGLQAFHLLRQLAFGQANGRVPANAHTIQELCALGAVTCQAAEHLLPEPATPLGLLDHAMAVDHLRRASGLWRQVGGRLYPRVQGLAKAPRVYHDAVCAVANETQQNRAATRVVLASLPGLAAQAATTIAALRERNELVSCQQPPSPSSPRWLPLDPTAGQLLADSLLAAGRATRTANTALRRQVGQRRRTESLTREVPVRVRARSVAVTP